MIIGYLEAFLQGSPQYEDQGIQKIFARLPKKEIGQDSETEMDARGLKIFLADAVSRLVWRLGLTKRDTGNSIPVLCYHRVLPEFVETGAPIYTILPEQFEAQMAFLAACRFRLPVTTGICRDRPGLKVGATARRSHYFR